MAILNYSHVFSSAGFSGEDFDVAQGPADTGVIDILLSAGDGALTEHAPHVLISTGALSAARQLDISGAEVESGAYGAQALDGRFFYLSVQNSDISTYDITVVSSSTINGATGFVISSGNDYLFHHINSGDWRVNTLIRPDVDLASLVRVDFVTTDWTNGTADMIKCLQTGSPSTGEIGPHSLAAYDTYIVQVINSDLTPDEMVDVEIQFAANGDITIRKAARAPDFNGTMIIAGTLT